MMVSYPFMVSSLASCLILYNDRACLDTCEQLIGLSCQADFYDIYGEGLVIILFDLWPPVFLHMRLKLVPSITLILL